MQRSITLSPQEHSSHERSDQQATVKGLVFCLLAFLLSVTVSIAPLNRLAGRSELLTLPLNAPLTWIGSWLPLNLGLSNNLLESEGSTHVILFLLLVGIEFSIYGLGGWWLQQKTNGFNQKRILRVILIGAIIAGLIFVLTPAMISHDAYVYAGYGRTLATYQANPYFVPLTAYPHDPFIRLDDWKDAPAAYGPVWLLICALGAFVAGDNPLRYVLFYRILGLVAHLINILLIITILRSIGRSPRTVTLGTWLYALNPLVLQESCLGGHNDTFMVTLMLLGIFLYIFTEKMSKDLVLTLRGYGPPLVAFTLATLIKFTGAPLIILFLMLLTCKTLQNREKPLQLQWGNTCKVLISAGLIILGIALVSYSPFWIGHPLAEIINSFTSPPSANQSYGSILHAIRKVAQTANPSDLGWSYTLFHIFSSHKVWQYINTATIGILLIVSAIWLWKVPTIKTFVLSTVMLLGALLIITPWFFPWYVIWIVGLIALCIPEREERVGRALLAATLTFSASAHFIYLFARGYAPIGTWIGYTAFTTIGPPLLVLFIYLLWPVPPKLPQVNLVKEE